MDERTPRHIYVHVADRQRLLATDTIFLETEIQILHQEHYALRSFPSTSKPRIDFCTWFEPPCHSTSFSLTRGTTRPSRKELQLLMKKLT